MNKQTKLQEVEQRIRELFQELMETNEVLYRCNRVWEAWNYGTMSSDDFEEVDDDMPEITLDHVLKAMGDSAGLLQVESDGIRFTAGDDWPFYKFGLPLPQQKEETIEFIHNILINK